MRPPSGVHGSGERVSATGSSNDCSPAMDKEDSCDSCQVGVRHRERLQDFAPVNCERLSENQQKYKFRMSK